MGIAQVLSERVDFVEDDANPGQQGLPLVSGSDPGPTACEERNAELRLGLLQHRARGRLGDVERLGGLSHRTQLGQPLHEHEMPHPQAAGARLRAIAVIQKGYHLIQKFAFMAITCPGRLPLSHARGVLHTGDEVMKRMTLLLMTAVLTTLAASQVAAQATNWPTPAADHRSSSPPRLAARTTRPGAPWEKLSASNSGRPSSWTTVRGLPVRSPWTSSPRRRPMATRSSSHRTRCRFNPCCARP